MKARINLNFNLSNYYTETLQNQIPKTFYVSVKISVTF